MEYKIVFFYANWLSDMATREDNPVVAEKGLPETVMQNSHTENVTLFSQLMSVIFMNADSYMPLDWGAKIVKRLQLQNSMYMLTLF